MAKRAHPSDCGCLHHLAKCPNCGSPHIEVRFTVSYDFPSIVEGRLAGNVAEVSLKTRCQTCDHLQNEYNSDLDHFAGELFKSLELPSMTMIDADDRGHSKRPVLGHYMDSTNAVDPMDLRINREHLILLYEALVRLDGESLGPDWSPEKQARLTRSLKRLCDEFQRVIKESEPPFGSIE